MKRFLNWFFQIRQMLHIRSFRDEDGTRGAAMAYEPSLDSILTKNSQMKYGGHSRTMPTNFGNKRDGFIDRAKHNIPPEEIVSSIRWGYHHWKEGSVVGAGTPGWKSIRSLLSHFNFISHFL